LTPATVPAQNRAFSMQITLRQTADKLGKSIRQCRVIEQSDIN